MPHLPTRAPVDNLGQQRDSLDALLRAAVGTWDCRIPSAAMVGPVPGLRPEPNLLLDPNLLLERADALAHTARDRQTVAITAAYLRGAHDRVLALAADHLADHPDDVVVQRIVDLVESPGTELPPILNPRSTR